MTEEKRLVIKIVSKFLQYPDESLFHSFESMTEVINALPLSRAREILTGFLQIFKSRKLLSWQEGGIRPEL